jgi:hypothetical protein
MYAAIPPTTATPVSLISGADFHPESLTADALLAYVQTRLQTLDVQIDDIFQKQVNAQKVRAAVADIKASIGKLDERKTGNAAEWKSTDNLNEVAIGDEIYKKLDEIAAIAPDVAQKLRTELESENALLNQLCRTQVFDNKSATEHERALDYELQQTDGTRLLNSASYSGLAVQGAKEIVDNVTSNLDATAQQDMIKLQSVTGTRGTTIGLITNLLAALAESYKAIVANTRA